jgi:hypothetical protein
MAGKERKGKEIEKGKLSARDLQDASVGAGA